MKKTQNTIKKYYKLFNKLANNPIAMLAFSFVVAVAAWGIVTTYFTESETKMLFEVEVNIDSSVAEENAFYPFYEDKEVCVDVEISGKSYLINSSSFSASDIVVTAQSGYIDSAGMKNLTVSATSMNNDIKIVSVSKPSVSVFFDRKETQTFDVEGKITNNPNKLVEKSYLAGVPAPSVATVKIEGPATVIANINKVIFEAKADEEKLPLTETVELEAKIDFDMKSERGKKYLSVIDISDDNSPTVTVPVSILKTIPTAVKFIGKPDGLKYEDLNIKIYPSQIKVAFSTETEPLDKLVIGTVNFNELKNTRKHYSFDAKTATGYTVTDDIHTYDVYIDMSSCSSKTIRKLPANIIFTGKADDKNYSLSENSGNLKSVTVMGPANSIKNIDADSLRAEINVSSLKADVTTPQKVTVSKITIDGKNDCWVYGSYNCYVEVK